MEFNRVLDVVDGVRMLWPSAFLKCVERIWIWVGNFGSFVVRLLAVYELERIWRKIVEGLGIFM